MDEADIETLLEIRVESLDNLSDAETALLGIEDSDEGQRTDLVNLIFRAFHTVKGTAGFFDLHLIVRLSHCMENLLVRVREGEIEYIPEMTEAFLAGIDKLNKLLDALPEVIELSIDSEMQVVKKCEPNSAGQEAPASAVEPAQTEAAAAPENPTAPCSSAYVLQCAEVMNISAAKEWHHELVELLKAQPQKIVIDASRVTIADTASFQVLLGFVNAVHERMGEVEWKTPSKSAMDSIELIGLTEKLGLHPSKVVAS